MVWSGNEVEPPEVELKTMEPVPTAGDDWFTIIVKNSNGWAEPVEGKTNPEPEVAI